MRLFAIICLLAIGLLGGVQAQSPTYVVNASEDYELINEPATSWPVAIEAYNSTASEIGTFQVQVSYDDGLNWQNTRETTPVRAGESHFLSLLDGAGWSKIDDSRYAEPPSVWKVQITGSDPGDFRLVRYIFVERPGRNGVYRY